MFSGQSCSVDEKFVKARKMKETLNNGECHQKLYIKKYY